MGRMKKLEVVEAPRVGLNHEYLTNLLRQKDLLEYIQGSFEGYEAGWIHKDICTKLEQFVQDILDNKKPRLMLFLPPRAGKSFICSERLPAWFIGNNPSANVIVASYSADLSQSFSKKALDLFQSGYHRSIFPSVELDENKQTADNWLTIKGGGYKSVGVGGSLTGHGAHLLIIDDPVKDWEQASSKTVRDKIWNWFQSTAYTRLMPKKSGCLVIQTRWHEDDLSGRIVKDMQENEDDPRAEKWEIISYPAIAERDEEHRSVGESFHPERFDMDTLYKIRKSVGPRVWSALYQQNPRPEGGRYIDSRWFKIIKKEEVPKTLRWVRGWDLAVKAKESNDETASTKCALDDEGNLYLADQIVYRKVWGASKATIVETALKENIPIGIESPSAMAIAIEEIKTALLGSRVFVKEVYPAKDKLTRALPWIDLAEQGKVFLVEGLWVQPFLDQCEAFDPIQARQSDDRIDSVTVGHEIIKRKKKARLIV